MISTEEAVEPSIVVHCTDLNGAEFSISMLGPGAGYRIESGTIRVFKGTETHVVPLSRVNHVEITL